ncbi:hypothetical protein ACFLU6_13720 [Acidobacteriota bacterium]
MKTLLKVVAIIVVLAIAGKYGYDYFMNKSSVDSARTRVTSMLESLRRADDQTALCQWAIGKPAMGNIDEMKSYLDRWDTMRRKNYLVEVKTYSIDEVVLQGDAVSVHCTVNGRKMVFEVRRGEPVSVQIVP